MNLSRRVLPLFSLCFMLGCGDGISIGPDYSAGGPIDLHIRFLLIKQPENGATLSGLDTVVVAFTDSKNELASMWLNLDYPDSGYVQIFRDTTSDYMYVWNTADEVRQGDRKLGALAIYVHGDSLHSHQKHVTLSN